VDTKGRHCASAIGGGDRSNLSGGQTPGAEKKKPWDQGRVIDGLRNSNRNWQIEQDHSSTQEPCERGECRIQRREKMASVTFSRERKKTPRRAGREKRKLNRDPKELGGLPHSLGATGTGGHEYHRNKKGKFAKERSGFNVSNWASIRRNFWRRKDLARHRPSPEVCQVKARSLKRDRQQTREKE